MIRNVRDPTAEDTQGEKANWADSVILIPHERGVLNLAVDIVLTSPSRDDNSETRGRAFIGNERNDIPDKSMRR